MTDVLDRTVPRPTADGTLREPLALEPLGSRARTSPTRCRTLDLSPILGWILAALAAAAGVIHLVMVPSHWGESVAEGIGFAVAGWIQLAVAWLVITRASRRLLYVAIGVSWALIGAWAWSRTMGLPFGAHAGHAETSGFVDLTTVGFEAAFIGVAALALVRPGFGRGWKGSSLAFAAVIPIAVVALATGAIASPSARDHAAGSHGEHGAAAAGHAHGTGAGATPVDDKGLSILRNGHHHEMGLEKPLDAATRAQLTREMALTHQVGVMYPTIADAVAAGYTRAGPYTPGLGTHYIRPNEPGLNSDGVMSDTDILSPLSLIYAGTGFDSPIAGFMYYSLSEKAPVGFAGPNDIWHYHTNICMQSAPDGFNTPLGADGDFTKKDCEAVGGNLLEQSTWMVHVWSLPGWESQQGLFGEVNPALTCADGTYYLMAKKNWPDHPLNFCKSEL